ncbi:MAG: D-glycero-beta-D-manno-heptose-7-phosphate kinase [Ignavibacteriae bacterium]|nr:D-glycero-beta-D-manno-heptose-7-phosphate kinase [Ignavibacteriota bacterium]
MNGKISEKILKQAEGMKVCIIGDVMLDRYMFGNVTRISPEAPVQVFETKQSKPKLGGAANVSYNVKTLGAEPVLIGVIGNDAEGEILADVMRSQGQNTSGLIIEENRPTTCKTRVIADSHHLLRIDSESKHDISAQTENKIISLLKEISRETKFIILQDYNKGVLTKSSINKIISFAKREKMKILVDPKFDNFFEYRDVYLFKPNRKELEDALGRKAKINDEINEFALELLGRIKSENIVLTLGENGMKIFEKKNGKIKLSSIDTHARKVADVSGAGDTVISTIAVCLAGGASLKDAVIIANVAAGLVVEEVGIVPIFRDNLLKYIRKEFRN